MPSTAISAVDVLPFHAAMNAPFAIAGGSQEAVENVLVRVRLRDGTAGWGEGAPLGAFNDDTQGEALRALTAARPLLLGKDVRAWRPLLEAIDETLAPGRGPARAALGMAVLDAWGRSLGVPLRLLFGGTETAVSSDVTVTLVSAREALESARRIAAMGVKTIKIKVGEGVEPDEARVRAVVSAAPRARLILDANQGYGPREALALLKRLRRRGVRPALFEQPAAKDDWRGLADVRRLGKVDVAADESVSSRADALRMARVKAVQVVNIKLQKSGLLEAWDIALICRAAGLRLMIGGMIESRLAMACAAHFAAGLGGFSFVDLDTPLWFARDPMRGGPSFSRGGAYDLSSVRAGIGVVPRTPKNCRP